MRGYRRQLWDGMRLPRATSIRLALIALAALCAAPSTVVAQADPQNPEPIKMDACASDPSKLGVSRVVEIDTTGGPEFGSKYGEANAFLNAGEVVLTFDDGPVRPYTETVLKALADHCTKATFFMVGRMAVSHADLVQEVAAEGHTIASHTWSHKNLGTLGLLRGTQEVERGISAITKANGAPISPFFRFPFLSGSRPVLDYARSRDIATFWVDVDSKDYQTRDGRTVHNRVMRQLEQKGKGIILMHDIQPSTARAIAGLLNDLRDNGYKVVHMVPKAHAGTVATYDADADGAIAERKARQNDNALTSRSITFEAEPPAVKPRLPRARITQEKPRRAKSAARARPAPQEEVLPWANPFGSPAPPTSKKSGGPKTTSPSSVPWQPTIFDY
jgi:peptidoglycan-N-acetylglucosamine deacetylase